VNKAAAQRPDTVLGVKKGLQQIADSHAKPVPRQSPGNRAQSPAASLASEGAAAQGASYPLVRQQVTLLYASKDALLALVLETHLQATGLRLSVFHNDGAKPGANIARSWEERLRNTSVFIPLVSADLWSDQKVWKYVQQVVSTKPSAQVVPVHLRPCWLDNGKFEGIEVVLPQPVTSFVGAAKESAWLDIVSRIVQTLQTLGNVYQPAPIAQAVVPPSLYVLPEPAPTRQVLPNQAQITAPASGSQPSSMSAPPSSDAWGVTVLYAPEDKDWIPLIIRTFTILQRSTMSRMGVRFVVHQGADGLSRGSGEEMKQRIIDSRITLALLSPDFLASEWMDYYEDLNAMLRGRGHAIIPVLLRGCEWHGGVAVPRTGAIGQVGNDAAWGELSKEIRTLFKHWYPNDMPPEPVSYWR
jgi:hypothetical protein